MCGNVNNCSFCAMGRKRAPASAAHVAEDERLCKTYSRSRRALYDLHHDHCSELPAQPRKRYRIEACSASTQGATKHVRVIRQLCVKKWENSGEIKKQKDLDFIEAFCAWHKRGNARADRVLRNDENVLMNTKRRPAYQTVQGDGNDSINRNDDAETYPLVLTSHPDRVRLLSSAIAYRVVAANSRNRAKFPTCPPFTRFDAISLLRRCQGRCTYCQIPLQLVCGIGSKEQYSIDRINNNKAYSVDNCAAACLFCNLASRTNCKRAFLKFIQAAGLGQVSGALQCDCDACTTSIPLRTASNVQKRLAARRITRREARVGSVANVLAMMERQHYKCAFSGADLMYCATGHPLAPSLDRVNNLLPHTVENCVLSSECMNLGRQSMTAKQFQNWILWRRSVFKFCNLDHENEKDV